MREAGEGEEGALSRPEIGSRRSESGVAAFLLDEARHSSGAMKRVVIVGAGGRLGAALVREYATEFDVVGFNHAQLDLGKPDQLRTILGGLEFEALINTAAQTNVDRCETHQEEAFALNGEAPRVLAEICAGKRARFIHVSTDYVFDGEKREPYMEEDVARPISVYGESKREGERRALEANDRALIVRVSWVFGPDRPSFVDWAIGQAREREDVNAIADKWATPTYTPDLAQLLKVFLKKDDGLRSGRLQNVGGIIHLANTGECSWQEYAQWALDCCRAENIPMKATRIGKTSLAEMKSFIAKRPVYSVLSAGKYESLTGVTPRPWQEAVAEFVREYKK
jgi:dTDP-4-dehydrorhamnose reductase